jgi:alpha-amylase/alpha-mannosidase (GH57 family)
MSGSDADDRVKKRYVIIHGHFYQPPRENPWLDIIEKQASASPDHDWNERIYDQCYRPNAYSRILDSRGMIVDIHNNYLYMSSNFGPTLFLWLEKNHPKVAAQIIAADRESCLKFKNHGNALAQVYNHMIMPLALRRDKLTQIRWAKEFFHKRYNREPEGFWLAETAINMETVECLIEEGVRFVVLSPIQAESVRPIAGNEQWKSASQGVDTRHAYRIFARKFDATRTGGHLDVFFFNEGLSREVSFGDLLVNANTLGAKIRSCYDDEADHDQAVVIATDGETFGHHKPFGDMCLAYFFSRVAAEMDIVPVNFGYFLEKNPPAFEVMLKNEFGEGTAWSCAHGMGRWSRDCGCKAGGPPAWNQAWRAPLRHAFDSLQKQIDETYEKSLSAFVPDPWQLRDAYQRLLEARTLKDFKTLLVKEGVMGSITDNDAMMVRRMLEAQKYMLFAYTSCGWFFFDISGIETVQNIAYAGRALALAIDKPQRGRVTADFLRLLAEAKSNVAGKDGAVIFNESVAPFLRHLEILCFTAVAEKTVAPDKTGSDEFDNFGFRVALSELGHAKKGEQGEPGMFLASINNIGSGEHARFAVCLARDDGQIRGWCLPGDIAEDASSGAPDTKLFLSHPETTALDLSSMFEESKVRLAGHFMASMARDTRNKYESWMEQNEKILDSLSSLGVPLPPFVAAPIAYVLTAQWNSAINEIKIYGREDDVYNRLLGLWKKTRKYNIILDYTESARLLLDLLVSELNIFAETLSEVSSERMRYLLNIVDRFAIPFSKNKTEDLFFSILEKALKPMHDEFRRNPESGHRETIIRLVQFARRMNFNTDAFPVA